jgi:peptide-methionine (R)-S-oxide reductase
MLAAVRPSAVVAKTTARKNTARRSSVVVMSGRRVDVARVEKSDADWKKELNAQEFQVLRKKGTEPARTGEYDKFYPSEGHFVCRGCGTPLYSAKAKFDSGCGWPAFDKCYAGAVKTEVDNSFGMRRVEIMCAGCDGHLGHVFENEGFSATMERHCVNSISVKYVKENEDAEEAKVVDGDVVSSASGMLRSPVVMLLGLYIVSDVFGRVMNFFAARQ